MDIYENFIRLKIHQINKINNSIIDILRGMRNDTMEPVTADPQIYEASLTVDKIISPIMYVIGFPGNIFSIIVWLQPRMRHSSGTYLAALGFADLLFLIIHVLFEVYKVWHIQMFDAPVICELLPVVYMATQYLSPMLVLAFTVERFIGVCFPLKREKLCTPFRARLVSAGLTLLAFALGSMQGYFYSYYKDHQYCGLRENAVKGGPASLWCIWTWVTEMLVFMCVPLLILLFNILIIKEVKRMREYEASNVSRPHTTTFSLLIVSFYFIVTTFPMSIVYAIRYHYIPSEGNTESDLDPTSQANYMLAKTIIEEIGMTHFACKFYIFLLAERAFREEFFKVILRVSTGRQNKLGEATTNVEYNETEVLANNHPDETKI